MEHLVIERDYVYNETRTCKKTCLVIKIFGFMWYMSGAITCVTHPMFIPYSIMLTTMFASCCNSARYEYRLYTKYGTHFYSFEEFISWKNKQLTNLNYIFNAAEVIIKLYFFIASWPIKLTMHDSTHVFSICEFNITVFKIHATIVLFIYSFTLLLFMCMWCSFFNHTELNQNPNSNPNSNPTYAIYTNETTNETTNEPSSNTLECSICLNTKTEPWVSTQCAHVFHRNCLYTWRQINATCPICRTSLS